MSITTEVSRSEALEAVMPRICPCLTSERRESMMKASGGGADRTVLYRYDGDHGVTVAWVGDRECRYCFSWAEMVDVCSGKPRQAGLL